MKVGRSSRACKSVGVSGYICLSSVSPHHPLVAMYLQEVCDLSRTTCCNTQVKDRGWQGTSVGKGGLVVLVIPTLQLPVHYQSIPGTPAGFAGAAIAFKIRCMHPPMPPTCLLTGAQIQAMQSSSVFCLWGFSRHICWGLKSPHQPIANVSPGTLRTFSRGYSVHDDITLEVGNNSYLWA